MMMLGERGNAEITEKEKENTEKDFEVFCLSDQLFKLSDKVDEAGRLPLQIRVFIEAK
jgi:hypothetical protein